MKRILLFATFIFLFFAAHTQPSVARIWDEQQLKAIRIDAARPPVQARNLFHVSLAMYDAWAVYDTTATTYLLGKTLNGVTYPFTGINTQTNIATARNMAISYAAYRLLVNRYAFSPNWNTTHLKLDSTMNSLGYNIFITSTDYSTGSPAALGNYIAEQVIQMGNNDGANQLLNYVAPGYYPVNAPLLFFYSGNNTMNDVTRWQPLSFVTCIDQNNIPCGSNTPAFICPHWGGVFPFSMPTSTAQHFNRAGVDYPVYYNPGTPPMLDLSNANNTMSQYCKWGHEMVVTWSSHLDPSDPTMIDISPASKGNIQSYPNNLASYSSFYNFTNGGGYGSGYLLNPVTGLPYTPQVVRRGDYTRVVSQYWADGPTSETPPGHWYVLLNEVSDHPGFVKKIGGVGPLNSTLDWDVKCYFALGSAMHDAAIACWGIKGWYDSPRPISMIRKMAALGQCTNTSLPNYHPGGIDLIPGYIEQVTLADPASLRGPNNINLNKIKVKSWKGFSSIAYNGNTPLNAAGVGWILAEEWMPYQRQTFVTPPFAGYVSGHSTYSRAGALSLTNLTGSAYFPGGLYEYTIPANSNFLGFEVSPTTTIKLQYASYKDASDEASLSRIWGGIHPPFDDLPARNIGEQIGNTCFHKAKSYFENTPMLAILNVNNNPACDGSTITLTATGSNIPVNATYVWKQNGVVISGANDSTYSTSSFLNNDVFVCEITAGGYSICTNVITMSVQYCNTNSLTCKLFLQGFYTGSGSMGKVLISQGQSFDPTITDSVTVELHESNFPYGLVESQTNLVSTAGIWTSPFQSNSDFYYIVIKHRNSIETWSADPVYLQPGQYYDFTQNASAAFGNNLYEVEPGVWSIFQGDILHDDAVDGLDYIMLEPDIVSGASGYLNTDLNGDGSIDIYDYIVMSSNIEQGITILRP